MLTIKEAIENLTYLAKESEVGEDSYILLDYHIPAHYDMTNAEFVRAVNAIDPGYDMYDFVVTKFWDYAKEDREPAEKTLLALAKAIEPHLNEYPELRSIAEAIRRAV